MLRCHSCGTENESQYKFCEDCGTPLFKPPTREITGKIVGIRVIPQGAAPLRKEEQLQDDEIYPCRWVLNQDESESEIIHYDDDGVETGRGPRWCAACLEFAGEYESYAAMMQKTNEAVPGYFPGWLDLEAGVDGVLLPFETEGRAGIACGAGCTCHIELMINAEWTRL